MDVKDNLLEFKPKGARQEVKPKKLKHIEFDLNIHIVYEEGNGDVSRFVHEITPEQLSAMPQGKLHMLNEVYTWGVKQVFMGLIETLKKTYTNKELGLPPEIHG